MVCVGGWVGEVQHPTLQSFKTQMAVQSHLSRSTALFSLALGLYPVLAMASQYLPSHTVYMHPRTRTHTLGHIQVTFTLQANQAAYSAITTNPAAANDLTHAGIQTNMLIATTGYRLSRVFF